MRHGEILAICERARRAVGLQNAFRPKRAEELPARVLALSALFAPPPDPFSCSASPVLFLPPVEGLPIRLWPSAAIFVGGLSVRFELDRGRLTVGERVTPAPSDDRFGCR